MFHFVKVTGVSCHIPDLPKSVVAVPFTVVHPLEFLYIL